MTNTGPLMGSIEPLIQYLKIYRRAEEDSAKETTTEVDVIDENYDIDYPFDNTKLTVLKSELTDLAFFRPLKDRMTFNSNDFLAIEVFDTFGQPNSMKYYHRRVFNATSNEPLIRYRDFINSDWIELDDSAFILIPLDQEEKKYLYNSEINRVIYNNSLNTAFAYNDVFTYDPKDAGLISGRYILKFINHEGKVTRVTERDFNPNKFKHKRPPINYTDRNIEVEILEKKGKVYLFPTIRKYSGSFILEYKYVLDEFSRFDIKHQPSAITIKTKYLGTFLYFINRIIFYDNNFDSIENKDYLSIHELVGGIMKVIQPQTNISLGNEGIRQLFIDQYIKYVSEELDFYKNKLEKVLEVFYYTPEVFIKHLPLNMLWTILGKSLKGSITNFGLDKEDIILKLLTALEEKMNEPKLFLDELLARKDSDNISYFFNLFSKMNTSNFDKYVRFIWNIWKQTIYKDFTEENSKITSEGETLLNYKSDKTIGFHHDNASIKYLTESNKVQIDILTKVVKQATVKISGKDATIPFHTTLEKSLLYDPYAPIAILKEDNPHFIFKDEGSDKNAKFAILPAFVMLAREEKAFWSNVVTGAEYAIDIITTASGVLNILKAGRLFKILKAGHKLIGRTKGATKAITAAKTLAGTVEVTSGIGNGLLKLLGKNDTPLGRSIAKYLFYLEMLSLSGELSVALHASLSKAAKEVITNPELPKIKRQAEKIVDNANSAGASKKSSKVVEAEETLEATRHLDEVVEATKEVFDIQKTLDDYVALRAKYTNTFSNSQAWNNLNEVFKGKINVKQLKKIELRKFYNSYIKRFPQLNNMNFGTFDTKIYKNGNLIENVKEFAHSKPKQWRQGQTRLAEKVDDRAVIERVNDNKFLENVKDLDGIKKINDSEIKYIYNFLTNHLQKGDYFIIEVKNIFTTCGSCRKEFLILKELLGDNVKIVVKSKDGIKGTGDLKSYLKIK